MKVWARGVLLPSADIEGSTALRYKTWATNSGRVSTGETVGDIQGLTWKIVLKYSMLSSSEKDMMDNLFNVTSPAYFPVTFEQGGIKRTFTCYASDFIYTSEIPVSSHETWYKGCSVSLIGKSMEV